MLNALPQNKQERNDKKIILHFNLGVINSVLLLLFFPNIYFWGGIKCLYRSLNQHSGRCLQNPSLIYKLLRHAAESSPLNPLSAPSPFPSVATSAVATLDVCTAWEGEGVSGRDGEGGTPRLPLHPGKGVEDWGFFSSSLLPSPSL